MIKTWPSYPLISALMVIDRPAMVPIARRAVNCFLQQTWPVKELVVFNSTGQRLFSIFDLTSSIFHRRTVREICLARMSPGEMLDVLLANARGEWCVLWDPDCWYAPDLLAYHMEHRDKETTVLLRNKTCYAVADKTAIVIDDHRVLHGSFFRLMPISFTDDKPFYRQTPKLTVLDNPPSLLVKFVSSIDL